MNGFDSLIITKLDVLDELDEIPVCVAYEVNGAVMHQMPASTQAMDAIKPVFETLPGWKTSTRGVTSLTELPQQGAALSEVSARAHGSRNWLRF